MARRAEIKWGAVLANQGQFQ